MSVALVAGSANPALADSVSRELGLPLTQRVIERFPDTELHVELLESVRGKDVYILQPTAPPVNESLVELALLADASRRAGAASLTAVVPYFAYARQDRRAKGRESVAARLVADLIATSGVQKVIAVDLHTSTLEGFFPTPIEHLSAVPLLAAALRHYAESAAVIVAPDLGAVKLAERYAGLMGLPMAVVHKMRVSPEAVKVAGVVGDVAGRTPVIVDDMISTGGTIEAAVQSVLAAGSRPEPVVAASHLLLVGRCVERLGDLGLRRLVGANTLPVSIDIGLHPEVVDLGPLLAEAIRRLSCDQSLAEMAWRG